MSKTLMAAVAALVLAGNTMADDYPAKKDAQKAADAAFFKKVDDRTYWKKVDDKKYWSEYDRKKAEETKPAGASFGRIAPTTGRVPARMTPSAVRATKITSSKAARDARFKALMQKSMRSMGC